MRWIREHKLIAGLLALLFVLVFIFTISMAFGGGNNSLTNLVNNGTNGVSGFLSSLGNGIRNQVVGIFSHGEMQERIDELEKENDERDRACRKRQNIKG